MRCYDKWPIAKADAAPATFSFASTEKGTCQRAMTGSDSCSNGKRLLPISRMPLNDYGNAMETATDL